MLTTKARIGLFMPEDREVYRVHRGTAAAHEADPQGTWPAPGGKKAPFDPGCIRCGGPISASGTGARTPLHFFHRDIGTSARGVRGAEIHSGCIPRDGETPQRIRARSLRASQVRA